MRNRLFLGMVFVVMALALAACAGGAAPQPEPPPPEEHQDPGSGTAAGRDETAGAGETTGGDDVADPPGDDPADPPAEDAPTTSMVVHFDAVRVGDTFGTFVVTDVGTASEVLPLGPDNFRVEFSGSATITGTYNHFEDLLSGGFSLWIDELEPESQASLPTLDVFPEYPGVLVRNYEAAAASFPPAESAGTATVVIERYVLQYLVQSDLFPAEADVAAVLEVN